MKVAVRRGGMEEEEGEHWRFQTRALPGKILVNCAYCFTWNCDIAALLYVSPVWVT